MRAIALRSITVTEKGYSVFLGNGSLNNFKNKKLALQFLADTTRFINIKAVELNDLYCQVFIIYRQSYFTFFTPAREKKYEYMKLEQTVRNNLDIAAEMFDKLTGMHASNNTYCFIDIQKICFFLTPAVEALITVNKNRNNTIVAHLLGTFTERLTRIAKEITEYKY